MIPTAWQAAGLLPALGLSLSAQSSTVTHHRRGRERGASASGGASGVLLPEAEEGPRSPAAGAAAVAGRPRRHRHQIGSRSWFFLAFIVFVQIWILFSNQFLNVFCLY